MTPERKNKNNDDGEGTSSPFSSSPFGSCSTSPQVLQYEEAQIAPAEDCDAVLDTIDSCVACAEGVELQAQYERQIQKQDAVAEHGLSDAEAALIRLQIMEEQKKVKGDEGDTSTFALPDTLDLNLCGNDHDDEPPTCFPPTPETSQKQETPQPSLGSSRSADEAAEQRSLSPASVGVSSVNSLQAAVSCAICFNSTADGDGTPKSSSVAFAYLPCCGSDGKEEASTTKVCTACILLLTNPISDGQERVGRCPRCRSWIAVTTEAGSVAIRAVESAGKCKICNQVKTVLVDNDEVCDACFLGRRRPLLYECEQCHGSQFIPHPIYRYQPSVDKFGSTSWACQKCSKFTMWRILPDQVRYIPAGDTPVEWGDNYLEIARATVMEARRGIVEVRTHEIRDREDGKHGCVVQ